MGADAVIAISCATWRPGIQVVSLIELVRNKNAVALPEALAEATP